MSVASFLYILHEETPQLHSLTFLTHLWGLQMFRNFSSSYFHEPFYLLKFKLLISIFQYKSKHLKFVIGFQEGGRFSLFYMVGFWFDEKSLVEVNAQIQECTLQLYLFRLFCYNG